jgi:hypothetical protein
MVSLKQVLLIVAVLLFVVAGLGVASPRVNLMALGLAAFAGSFLVG